MRQNGRTEQVLGPVFLIGLVVWWGASCGVLPDTPAVSPQTSPSATLASLPPSPSPSAPASPEAPTATPSAEVTPEATRSPTASPPTTAATETAVPPASPTPSPSPTARPSPEPTAPVDGPVVRFFRADVELADPGDTITLSWESAGATEAVLYKVFYYTLPPDGWDVPTTGTFTYTIAQDEQNWVSFLLTVSDAEGRHESAGATVNLRCRHAWFFEPAPEESCPTEPLISPAAEQAFERGTMIWVEAEDAIYVLYDQEQAIPRWSRFTDEWDLGEPELDPGLQPPPGLLQPIRGFGLLWREAPYVREQLGWAVTEEQGYTTVMQRTTRIKYNAWTILARDGDVWHLQPEGSGWARIDPLALTLDPAAEAPQ